MLHIPDSLGVASTVTREKNLQIQLFTMLDSFQQEALLSIAVFLPAKDVLSLISTNSYLKSLGSNPKFWATLCEQHYSTLIDESTAAETKDAFLLKVHCDSLESVRWHRITDTCHNIQDREGHLGCRLGNDNIITGGFVRDIGVYIQRPGEIWRRLVPREPPLWVYGATLTALADGQRAVRFGGFTGGGYSNETANVSHSHEMVISQVTLA